MALELNDLGYLYWIIYIWLQSLASKQPRSPVAETLRNLGGASAEGTSFLGGSGGMPPQKIFKIWTPEMAFAAF